MKQRNARSTDFASTLSWTLLFFCFFVFLSPLSLATTNASKTTEGVTGVASSAEESIDKAPALLKIRHETKGDSDEEEEKEDAAKSSSNNATSVDVTSSAVSKLGDNDIFDR